MKVLHPEDIFAFQGTTRISLRSTHNVFEIPFECEQSFLGEYRFNYTEFVREERHVFDRHTEQKGDFAGKEHVL